MLALSLAFTTHALVANADDPACAVRTATSRVLFQSNGPVEFGPGTSGMAGSSMLGIRYNLLLLGDYDWNMAGALHVRWPPALKVSATGDAMGGHLTVQYGLRLQVTLRVFGVELALPLPMWVGMADRSERGSSTFTPWAWTGDDTAVRVTATERLLREGDLAVPIVNNVHYRVYASYELTTTVRTREIAFPQAMTSITATNPEADVAPTANGDVMLPARWAGSLRYVGSLRLRVEVSYPVCVAGICTMTTMNAFNDAIPFASATEQQMSVDRSARVQLPGATSMPTYTVDFGRVRLGLSGRQDIALRNPGTVTALMTPGMATGTEFQWASDPMCVGGGATRTFTTRFIPTREGRVEVDLPIETSAPSVPSIMLHLVGEGYDPNSTRDAGPVTQSDAGGDVVESRYDSGNVFDDVPTDDDAAKPEDGGVETRELSGCGCRVGGHSTHGAMGAMGVLLAMCVAARRQRRG